MKLIYQGEKVSLVSELKDNKALPRPFKKLPFQEIKESILGKKYELSIVLVGKSKMKSLNKVYRGKNEATDVLSFEIDSNNGEIFINPEIAKKKAPEFSYTFEEYLLFLVIHASLHLKGLEHGDKMERYEFAHYNRYRHRHL